MALWQLYYHFVWGTAGRSPLITPSREAALYPYIRGKADYLSCQLHAIGGIENHIHLILSIPPKHSISTVVKQLKGSSAHHLNHGETDDCGQFRWQQDYAVFSLGPRRLDWAIAYVNNQKHHHATGQTVSSLEATPSRI
jgi:putative transposase